jgi:hypothetical protein
MSTTKSSTSMSSNSINFINEDNARSITLSLLKEISNSRSSNVELLIINDTKSDASEVLFQKAGNGLSFNVAGYYNLSRKSRMGMGLGVLAFFNSVNDKQDFGKSSFTQNYRNLYFSYNYLY